MWHAMVPLLMLPDPLGHSPSLSDPQLLWPARDPQTPDSCMRQQEAFKGQPRLGQGLW